MRAAAAVLILVAILSGCTAKTPPAATPSSSPEPSHLPPKQLLSREGNNAQCTEVLSGEVRIPFTLEEGYDVLEVTWHATGLGNVGFDILAPDGAKLHGVPDSNPSSQPCNHLHEGGAQEVPAAPGDFVAVVRNVGILSWHLQINEKVAGEATPDHAH